MRAIVTGASRGLGLLIAEELESQGLEVVSPSRDRLWILKEEADVLVNNAAVYGPIGSFATNDWEAWRQTFDIDFLLPAKLCHMVLPGMIKRGYGKIINISGGGACEARPNFSAYSAAKTALVRFTETLAEEVRLFHIDVNAVAPGAHFSGLTKKVLEAGPEIAGIEEYRNAEKTRAESPDVLDAVRLCAFLASRRSDGVTGRLISALWDPWEVLAGAVSDTDQYTLRRTT